MVFDTIYTGPAELDKNRPFILIKLCIDFFLSQLCCILMPLLHVLLRWLQRDVSPRKPFYFKKPLLLKMFDVTFY